MQDSPLGARETRHNEQLLRADVGEVQRRSAVPVTRLDSPDLLDNEASSDEQLFEFWWDEPPVADYKLRGQVPLSTLELLLSVEDALEMEDQLWIKNGSGVEGAIAGVRTARVRFRVLSSDLVIGTKALPKRPRQHLP
jgi:hypothetical protein